MACLSWPPPELMCSSTSASIRYCRLSLISTGTPTAKTISTIQAPSLNFTTAKMITTTSEVTPAEKLITSLWRQPRSLVHVVIPGHAEAGQRERGEHADRVERDQRVDVRARRRPAACRTARRAR